LRETEFDLTKLTRTVYEDGDGGQADNGGSSVSSASSSSASTAAASTSNVKSLARWTNSRLIEWLRCIDLAEFADNLKVSDVANSA
jgi:hypothetical protein